jgi:hypothetical protein
VTDSNRVAEPPAVSKEPRLAQHGSSQQRTPGQRDADLVRAPVQLGRQCLRGRDDECGVGQPATLGAARGEARGVPHGVRGGVDAQDRGARLGTGGAQDGATVAGTQVDDESLVSGDPAVELADVHVEQSASDELLHGRRMVAPRASVAPAAASQAATCGQARSVVPTPAVMATRSGSLRNQVRCRRA